MTVPPTSPGQSRRVHEGGQPSSTARSGPPPPVPPKPQVRFSAEPTPGPHHLSTSPHFPGIVPVLPTTGITQESAPVLPPYTENPAPLYHQQEQELYITTPSSAYSNLTHSPSPSPPIPAQFELPDIQSSLSVKERDAVSSISGMGFPMTRVARSYKRLDGDNQAVCTCIMYVHVCTYIYLCVCVYSYDNHFLIRYWISCS